MARVLYDGLVEYEDGTPANTSQMAKDVTNFLAWTSEPEHDQRKKMGMQVSRTEFSFAIRADHQAVIILSTMTAISLYIKRFKWTPIKNRKLFYNPPSTKSH